MWKRQSANNFHSSISLRDHFLGHKSEQRTLDSTINLSKTCKRITFSCLNSILFRLISLRGGARDGPMLRALAFHQCGPGSNLGVNAIIMRVAFVVGSLLCFQKLYSGYSYPQEPAFINPNSTRNGKKRTTMWMRYLKIIIHSFIYLLISVA